MLLQDHQSPKLAHIVIGVPVESLSPAWKASVSRILAALLCVVLTACQGVDRRSSPPQSVADAPPAPPPPAPRRNQPYIEFRDDGPNIGSRLKNPRGYLLSMFDFGIEQVQDGKVASFRKQIWTLQCDAREATSQAADYLYCSLTRLVIDNWSTVSGDGREPSVRIGSHSHSTTDGTLRDVRADWESGKLDFKMVHSDGAVADVRLRFRWIGDAMHLTDFKALTISRGRLSDELAAIEYRIARYTRIERLPVEINGYKPEGAEAWEKLFAEFTAEDQKTWSSLVADDRNRASLPSDLESRLRAAHPEITDVLKSGRKPTGAEEETIRAFVYGERVKTLRSWLSKTHLSDGAQQRILQHASSGQ